MKSLFKALPLALLLASACSPRNDLQIPTEETQDWGKGFVQTSQVMDHYGNSIANAKILIGHALDVPFGGNYIQADENGEFKIPSEWSEPLPVTIAATGYVRSTYLSLEPMNRTYKLSIDLDHDPYEVRGNVNGFGELPKDKFLDFGMVVKMVDRRTVMDLDTNELISPYIDIVKVMGQKIEVPSNFSIPKQKVKYGILTLGVSKPAYRTYTRFLGLQNYYVAQGNFHLKKVADIMNSGGDMLTAANELNFTSGGFNNGVVSPSGVTIPLTVKQLAFTTKSTLVAPIFPSNYMLMTVLLNKREGSYYVSDLKKFDPGESRELIHPTGTELLAVSLLGESEQINGGVYLKPNMSVALTDMAVKNSPEFLDHVAAPEVVNPEWVRILPPSENGMNPMGTYATLETLRTHTVGTDSVSMRSKKWEVFADHWIDEIQMPEFPEPIQLKGQGRWTIGFAAGGIQSGGFGPDSMAEATHLTRNSTEF